MENPTEYIGPVQRIVLTLGTISDGKGGTVVCLDLDGVRVSPSPFGGQTEEAMTDSEMKCVLLDAIRYEFSQRVYSEKLAQGGAGLMLVSGGSLPKNIVTR